MTAQAPPADDQDELAHEIRTAERALLGNLLTAPERAAALLVRVPAAAFWDLRHETIWRTAADLVEEGRAPDHVALVSRLHENEQLPKVGGDNYLLQLRTASDWTAAPEATADQIVRAYARRKASTALTAARSRLERGEDDPTTAIEFAMDQLDEAIKTTWDPSAGATAADRQFEDRVQQKVRDLKVHDAARARHRAEQVANSDFTDLYLTRHQLINLPTPEPLIDRVLPRHAYGILRGRDHTLKSFVAIDWACCLATGKPWQTRTTHPTRVLYIAGEGAHGLATRIAAWEYAWNLNVPNDMLTIRRTALNLHQPGPAFDDLLARITADGYGLVVIDTLRRVSGTADANSSEMGAVVDNLDRIKHATNDGTVLAIAHTDKSDHDTRGYSGIEDDADFVWATRREDMLLTLELTKMKDGPDGTTVDLEAQPTIGSLVLVGSDGLTTPDTTESQAKILDALRDYFPDGASSTDLQAASGLAKSTYYRARKDLLTAGHILNTGTKKRPFYERPSLLTDAETTPTETTDQALDETPQTLPDTESHDPLKTTPEDHHE